MGCIKHVIRYISIKQLLNLSKYVLNNQGCRWLTDWTKEQKTKEKSRLLKAEKTDDS